MITCILEESDDGREVWFELGNGEDMQEHGKSTVRQADLFISPIASEGKRCEWRAHGGVSHCYVRVG